MEVRIFDDKNTLGAAAAACGAGFIREALREKGRAAIIVATGASQFEMLSSLVAEPDIDWSCVEIFHLDEYVGLPEDHPAGFRRYLRERFVSRLPMAPKCFHPVDPEALAPLAAELARTEIDVAFVGIGENGHLAFNDPPADFETEEPYLIINLDERCRRQQLGEGWFPSLDAVPKRAASMSIRQILKSRAIVNTVPDQRKAEAVKGALEGKVSNLCPASVLQTHPKCFTFLDRDSASLLTGKY